MKRQRSGQSGFTLLETVIALLLMMIVGLAATSLFVFSINYNSGANDRAMALGVAQRRLEELRQRSFTHASLAATDADGDTETITSASRQYYLTTTITNDSSTIKTIRIDVVPAGASGAWAAQAVTLLTRRASTETGDYVL
ncbi:MAG TPA: type II secretion system protein [Rhodothermales bacterium]|nr:type II secretion system protein [Rhodothermales bacterium]